MTKAVWFRSFLCSVVVLFGLVEFLHGRFQVLVYAGGAVALVTFLVILPVTAIYTRIIASVLCLSGLAALFFSGTFTPAVFIEGFKEMTPLVALLAAVSLLGIPLEMGRYAELFHGFYSRAKRLYQTYLISLIISYFLSLVASLGSVTPSYYLVKENLNKMGLERNSRFDTTCIIRGFAMAIIISPVAVNVGIALQYSGLSWLELIGPIFILSLGGMMAAFFAEPSWKNKDSARSFNLSGDNVDVDGPHNKRQLRAISPRRYVSFIFLFAIIISSIFFLGNVLHFSSLNSISTGCLLAILTWGILSGRLREVFFRSAVFFKQDIVKISDQIILFLSAGFFTHSMENSRWLISIGNVIEEVSGKIGTASVLCLVPVVIVFLAMMGLHPFASCIIIGKTLSVSALHFNQLGLAAALLSGGTMSFMVSPFSATVLLLSTISGNTPYRVGARWNIGFAAVFWGITAVFITLAVQYY